MWPQSSLIAERILSIFFVCFEQRYFTPPSDQHPIFFHERFQITSCKKLYAHTNALKVGFDDHPCFYYIAVMAMCSVPGGRHRHPIPLHRCSGFGGMYRFLMYGRMDSFFIFRPNFYYHPHPRQSQGRVWRDFLNWIMGVQAARHRMFTKRIFAFVSPDRYRHRQRHKAELGQVVRTQRL